MNNLLMTYNSYARFVGNGIDYQNRTAFDVLKLYKIANVTAKVVAALSVRAIKFVRDLLAANVSCARVLATVSLIVRMIFSFADQPSTLTKALVKILHLSKTESYP